MFEDQAVGLGGAVTLGLAVAGIITYLLINAKNAAAYVVALFVIVIPLMSNRYLPGQVFGIRGLSPVNLLTALAFAAIILKISLSGRAYGYAVRFLSVPLLLCIVVYAVGVGLTLLGGDDHPFFEGSRGLEAEHHSTKSAFVLLKVIRPIQVMLVGLLVYVTCDLLGNKQLIQRSVLIAPIALSTMALFFSLQVGLDNYVESREVMGNLMGLHGNSFGALSVYFLVAAITMREHEWPATRYAAIGFAMLGIVLSFSRIAFIATAFILAVLYFRLPAKERIALASLAVVIVLIFSSQLIARIFYGFSTESPDFDINAISAGRVADIWIPGFNQFLEKPFLGYGIGMLVSTRLGFNIIAHNSYLELVLDIGLLGLLVFSNLFFRAMRDCAKNNDELFYLLLVMLVLTLTGHTFYPATSNYVLWVFYGMTLHTRYRKEPIIEIVARTPTSGEADHRRKKLQH